MSGIQYTALSGLRARMDQLDALASDIANMGTAGYKGQRDSFAAIERSPFAQTLQTAIDTTNGATRLDATSGAIAPTGRPLDLAIDGNGFFEVQAHGGVRFTRNGHFSKSTSGQLTTEDGDPVLDPDGKPIQLSDGELHVDPDGTVWSGTTQNGKIAVVTFDHPDQLAREGATLLRADNQNPTPVADPTLRSGALEQSNVSVSDRLAELTSVQRGFEALQKALSLMMNDVDGKAIDTLGHR